MKPNYRRMLEGMRRKTKFRRSKKKEIWFLYILECRDGSFYTGITKDLERRIAAHNQGRASRYTRTRLPVRLRYHETCTDRTQALLRECAVKSLSRKAKEKLMKLTSAPSPKEESMPGIHSPKTRGASSKNRSLKR